MAGRAEAATAPACYPGPAATTSDPGAAARPSAGADDSKASRANLVSRSAATCYRVGGLWRDLRPRRALSALRLSLKIPVATVPGYYLLLPLFAGRPYL